MQNNSANNDYYCQVLDSAAINLESFPDILPIASRTIVNSLLNDGKIIIFGSGHSTPIASHFTSCLMNQHEFERPSLPAVNISTDMATIAAITKDSNYNEIFSKQIRAMGNTHDTVVALSVDGNCGNILQAIQAAHDKAMNVITIVGYGGGHITSIKQADDIEIPILAHSMPRVLEAQLFVTNALCHLVENQLFGAECPQ